MMKSYHSITVPTNPAAIARRKTAGSVPAPALTDIDFTSSLSIYCAPNMRRPQFEILLLCCPAESHNHARENNLTGESKRRLRRRLQLSPAAQWGLDLRYRQTWPAAASLSLSLMRRTLPRRQCDCGKRAIMPSG